VSRKLAPDRQLVCIQRGRGVGAGAPRQGGMGTKHAFLSDEWVLAARRIYSGHVASTAPATTSVRMNLVIEDVPFGDGTLDAHLDTSQGFADLDLGHLDSPELTVHLDYELAEAVLVKGDVQAGAEAFMTGRVRMEGDVTKLLAFQQATPSPAQLSLTEEIRAITA